MEKNELINNDIQPVDVRTDYGKGFGDNIDPITDYGKGNMYNSIEDKQLVSTEKSEISIEYEGQESTISSVNYPSPEAYLAACDSWFENFIQILELFIKKSKENKNDVYSFYTIIEFKHWLPLGSDTNTTSISINLMQRFKEEAPFQTGPELEIQTNNPINEYLTVKIIDYCCNNGIKAFKTNRHTNDEFWNKQHYFYSLDSNKAWNNREKLDEYNTLITQKCFHHCSFDKLIQIYKVISSLVECGLSTKPVIDYYRENALKYMDLNNKIKVR